MSLTANTIKTMIHQKFYNSAFEELSRSGTIEFDTKFKNNGQRMRVLGGKYHHHSWAATVLDDSVENLEFDFP